ncbi:MAG: diguanylate cyclase [Acidimicrobiales bacterium]|jgi:diguanylate cyclase (GGDEF)-like protein/PAS domain S-box-containing protein
MASLLDALNAGSLSAAALRDLASLSQRAISELDQLRQLVEHIPAVLYIDEMTEPRTGAYPTIYVGPQIESVLGITQEEWIKNADVWQQHIHPDDWPAVIREYSKYLERGGVLVQEYRLIRPDDGRLVWVRDDCAMSVDPTTGRRILLGVMFDITAQKLLEAQLRAAEAKNRALIEQIPSVVWIEPLNENPEPAYVSAAVESVFGVSRKEWLNTPWWERHLHPEDRDGVLTARQSVLSSPAALHLEYRMTTATGRDIWIGEVSQVVRHDGRPWLLQGLLDDITSRKRDEEQLQFRASHDPLTGLANRPLFDESLDLALARARRGNLEVAVLFVDVDGFKQVNDAHGHDAGDRVLRIVAARLQQCARESDLVARRGGDEFLVLLPDIEPSLAGSADSPYRGVEVADFIVRRILQTMESPIELDTGPVAVSLSIGRCVYPWDASDARTMMAVADATMYLAKQDR